MSVTPPSDARKAALTVLNILSQEKHTTLDTAFDEVLEKSPHLEKRDRALATAITYGVLRWQEQLDFYIRHYSKTPFKKINPFILNILRIGLFQIIHLDKIPASAAVNTSVNLSKSYGKAWAPKYINGILRNAVRTLETVPFPDNRKDPLKRISVEKSFPLWMINRWKDRFGFEKTVRLCDAINEIPPITIRANLTKTSRESLIEKISQHAGQLSPTLFSPAGISLIKLKTPIPDFEAFMEGEFQVQDEAAQLVSLLLAPLPSERVLDACAGLGGKTGHLAEIMENQGEIVAVDIDGKKLEKLNTEMDRLGITIVSTKSIDLEKEQTEGSLGKFNKILVDAPCSGLGVIRRNPDTKWRSEKKELSRYKNRQIRLLNTIASLLESNGVIVYSVCSTEPEEGEEVVQAFIERNPEFIIDKQEKTDPALNDFLCDDDSFRTFPHKNDMDGFFAVRLRRVK